VEAGCTFCLEIEVGRSRVTSAESSPYFFWEGDDVFVVADIAPIVAGHILIVSKHHRTNFWDDWRTTGSELHKIIALYRRFSASHLGKAVVAFEHGVAGSLREERGACIDHAHVHLAPINGTLLPQAREAGAWLTDWPDARHQGPEAQCYLLNDTDGGEYALATEHFESQFFRFVLARHAGSAFWDWKDFIDFRDALGAKTRYAETVAILRRALGDPDHGGCD
jgi:diadenosine tetraphosphate (Ap4A) HIT family hydrolase